MAPSDEQTSKLMVEKGKKDRLCIYMDELSFAY